MTIEIREVIIKTQVYTAKDNQNNGLSQNEYKSLKKRIMKDCLSEIKKNKSTGFMDR